MDTDLFTWVPYPGSGLGQNAVAILRNGKPFRICKDAMDAIDFLAQLVEEDDRARD